jgi:hypothetical protein
MANGIRAVEAHKDSEGNYNRVRLVFGPHYFVELHVEESGGVLFVLGATHHGFRADASEVDGELERIINEVRRAHPQNVSGTRQ